MSAELAQAITKLAEASAKNAELFDKLFSLLPPKTRAEMLGVSVWTERRRRKQAAIKARLK